MFSSPSRPPSPTAWAQNSQINDDSSILPDMWPLMTLAPGNVIQNRLIINRTAEMEKHWFWHQLILHRLHRHCIQNCVFFFSDTSVLKKKSQEKKNIHQEMYPVLLYRMKSNIYKQLLKWDSEGGGTLRSGVAPFVIYSSVFYLFFCSFCFKLSSINHCVITDVCAISKSISWSHSLRQEVKRWSEGRLVNEWVPVCLRNKTSLPAHLLFEHVIRKRGSRGGEKKETPQNTFGKVELVKNILFTWCSITTNKFFFFFCSDMTWTQSHLFLNHRACFHSNFRDVAKQQQRIQWRHEWK